MPHRTTDLDPPSYDHLQPKHKPLQIVGLLTGIFLLLTSAAMWGLGRRPATDLSPLVPKASASATADDPRKATPASDEQRQQPAPGQSTAQANSQGGANAAVSTTLVRAKATATR
jgi:hypothetical protein